MAISKKVRCLILSISMALFTSSCEADEPLPSNTIDNNEILLQVDSVGGFGASGSMIIFMDKKLLFISKAYDYPNVYLTDQEFENIKMEIGKADFIKIKSNKFTGMCPSARDLAENIYYFHLNTKVEIIASCTYAIDMKSSLFESIFIITKKYSRLIQYKKFIHRN